MYRYHNGIGTRFEHENIRKAESIPPIAVVTHFLGIRFFKNARLQSISFILPDDGNEDIVNAGAACIIIYIRTRSYIL